jgi:hypothetical protein
MVQYIRKLLRFETPTRFDWLIYFSFFTILHIPGILNFYKNDGIHNPYLLFAQSLLHGHLTLPVMPGYEDMILYHDKYFLPYPPFPSLVLLPFVAIFGTSHVNTVFVVLLMSCLNLYLLHKIMVRLKIELSYFPWMIVAFFFGTGYWFALFTSHHVYSFAQITSCTLQLLLLNELFGKKRWWLAGIYIGCSFLTRQFTIFYFIFVLGYMLYLHQQQQIKIRPAAVAMFGISIGFFVGIYLLYNSLRFGNPLDPGYAYILFNGVLKERVSEYGVFSPKYFFFNLYSFFIKGFNIEFKGPGLLQIKDMDFWGTSLLSSSPFFIASIKAKWETTLKISAWCTVILILFGILLYHNNGFHQINTMRFSLDFLPMLFVLTMLGLKSMPTWLFKGCIAYAIFLNLLSYIIHYLYQTN